MSTGALERVFLEGGRHDSGRDPLSMGKFGSLSRLIMLNYARLGFLKLGPRDCVFVHDSSQEGLESDVFVAVQVDRCVIVYSS